MKKIYLFAILITVMTAFAGCAGNTVSDIEVRTAYLAWFHATSTLTTVVDHTENAGMISEILANDAKTYTRHTVYDPATKIITITHVFTGYIPADAQKMTITGNLVQTVDNTDYSLNGILDFTGTRPAKLTFMNVSVHESIDGEKSSLYPVEGTLLADDRSLSCSELISKIWQ